VALRVSANENVPGAAVAALRAHGHDVWWCAETSPGLTDHEVLDRAYADRRIVLTFDKDFGELVFQRGLPAAGVVLFRVAASSPEAMADLVVRFVTDYADALANHFSIVSDDPARVRIVPLPSQASTPPATGREP
jgi:predicted nuclease of predicted toxin-antitoxin system